MDSEEEVFFDNLMATFREEAMEHLKVLSDGFLELEKKLPPEEHQELIETIFREAHSLKGAARAVNQQSILEICQTLETVLSLYNQKKITISADSFDILHAAISTIKKTLLESPDSIMVSNAIEQLKVLAEHPLTESSEHSSSLAPKVVDPPVAQPKLQGTTIRVSLDKINQFFHEAEETLMVKLIFNNQLKQIKDLYLNLLGQEKNLKRVFNNIQMLHRHFHDAQATESQRESTKDARDFLETHLREVRSTREGMNILLKNTEQNVHIVGATIDKLLEDLKKILMQPMIILFETLPHMVRDISRKLSKEIHLEFQGENIEVDRRVLEEIKDPVMHLIRNAIDHGIESSQERIKHNKPTFGTIHITATESEGNKLLLSIADDGQGIDLLKLKQVALQKGVISQKEFDLMSDEAAIKLAFQLDISTSPIITEISGRGYGLNVVSEKVEKLGGQINVTSIPHQGTTFNLTLPLTLATFRGIRVSIKGNDFILPTHYVKRVVRIKANDIRKAENSDTVVLGEQTFSFVHLANLLDLKKTENSYEPEELYVLIVKAADHTIAFGADSIHNEQEILVKGLGKQPIHVRNIMAATVSETGYVIPILNPVDLIKSAIKGNTASAWKPKKPPSAKKTILIVEDSITTRLMLKNILESVGYDVTAAVDGWEAFEILQSHIFDLMVADIEMPRMNGFELTAKVRAMPNMKELPIIICTALGSKEDRKRGIELGANAYLDKSSFNKQTFLGIVKNLI